MLKSSIDRSGSSHVHNPLSTPRMFLTTTFETSNSDRRRNNQLRSDSTGSVGRGNTNNAKSHIISIFTGNPSRTNTTTVGFAVMDLTSPELMLTQFTDDPSFSKLISMCELYNPIEIIIPSYLIRARSARKVKNQENVGTSNQTELTAEQTEGNVYSILKKALPNVGMIEVDKKYYDETQGLDCIRSVTHPKYSAVEIEIQSRSSALSAANALLKYLEYVQKTFIPPATLKVTYQASKKVMMIDSQTAKALEMVSVHDLVDPFNCRSFFDVLNKTHTRAGAKLMRKNILSPSTQLEVIESRLDIVDEILADSEMFTRLQFVLSHFGNADLNHLVFILVQMPKLTGTTGTSDGEIASDSARSGERTIENVIFLKHFLSLIPYLKSALEGSSRHTLIQNYYAQLEDPRFEQLNYQINLLIKDECVLAKGALQVKMQKCYAVRDGINNGLDMMRKVYSEIINDIYNCVEELTDKYSLPYLKVKFTVSKGYHIQFSLKEEQMMLKRGKRLPLEFIQVTRTKTMVSCNTETIIAKNNRLEYVIQEIYKFSNIALSGLLVFVRQNVECLFNLCEMVADLDLIFSFAMLVSSANNPADYVRPKFANGIAIEGGKHPVLDNISHLAATSSNKHNLIPNGCHLDDYTNFMLLTGPNMSGKSVYLKQIALLQIMAQMGCFVPAKQAQFRITDRLFSRIGSNDDFKSNCSTFTIEMIQAGYILNNLTKNSLVIVDEIGRGTSVEEGAAFVFAIAEELLRSKAFTIFATHFTQITRLEDLYFNVRNYHFKVEYNINEAKPEESLIHFTHELEDGIQEAGHYGLKLAELSSLPKPIVRHAKQIAEYLENVEKQTRPDLSRIEVYFDATQGQNGNSEQVDETRHGAYYGAHSSQGFGHVPPTPIEVATAHATYNLGVKLERISAMAAKPSVEVIKEYQDGFHQDVQYYLNKLEHLNV